MMNVAAQAGIAVVDGRAERGRENRRRIVAAMLALVGKGNVRPSAEEVAAKAGVGLRSVFRHFDDMETLFREMNEAKKAELEPIIDAPLSGATWQERFESLIERRCRVFEEMLPFKTAADLRRHGSKFLQAEHMRQVRQLRHSLLQNLPPALVRDSSRVEALDMAMSLESWRRLRVDQRLGVAASLRAMAFAAHALIRSVA